MRTARTGGLSANFYMQFSKYFPLDFLFKKKKKSFRYLVGLRRQKLSYPVRQRTHGEREYCKSTSGVPRNFVRGGGGGNKFS